MDCKRVLHGINYPWTGPCRGNYKDNFWYNVICFNYYFDEVRKKEFADLASCFVQAGFYAAALPLLKALFFGGHFGA